MITIETYKKFPDRTFGLGQDVSTNLLDIVKVPALFVNESVIHKDLENDRLRRVTLEAGAPTEVYEKLANALKKEELTRSELVTLPALGRKRYASGLIRAIFDGQKNPAITDWAAVNYLAVAIGMGLIDVNYDKDIFFITDLGKKAVSLLDQNEIEKLRNFMLDRLFEYPYAAWMIRLINQDKSKSYSKFDLGDNFGFIHEPGFLSLPESLYIDAIFDAKIQGDSKAVSKIRSNYESTADKYMRWLAGVLVDYKLLKKTSKKYKRSENGTEYTFEIPAYQVTLEGVRALNRVNGGSRFHRSIKRVRWENLAPKAPNASKRKTARALMLKFLEESSNGLDADRLSEKINEISPSIGSIPDQVLDDAIGLNRIGIEIEINGTHLKLKEQLYDFEIPVKKNNTFKSTVADEIKDKLLPHLKKVNHKYLKAVDIAYKKNTSNLENTLLESLSSDLFTKEMNYHGKHLGGSNKPDAFAYTDKEGWILDSKAYSNGFAVTAHSTDAMGRYIEQYRKHNDKSTWWKEFPDNLPQTYFAYVSSFYVGKYQSQLKDFENRNNMKGGLIEIAKLLLVAENYKEHKLTHDQVTSQLLNDHIQWNEYSSDLINE